MKGYKMIATKSFLAWLKVSVPSILFSLLCIGISIWLLTKNNPDYGFQIYRIFSDKPWACLLLFISIIFILLFIIIANRYALQTMAMKLRENNSTEFMIPVIHDYINKLHENNPDWQNEIKPFQLKKELLTMSKNDQSLNSIQRKMLLYGLSKIKLEKEEICDEEYKIPHYIVNKIETKIDTVINPSFASLWILLLILLLILILALILT